MNPEFRRRPNLGSGRTALPGPPGRRDSNYDVALRLANLSTFEQADNDRRWKDYAGWSAWPSRFQLRRLPIL